VYFIFQGLQGGWLRDYSFRCQPVDYSNNPVAMRVRIIYIITTNGKEANIADYHMLSNGFIGIRGFHNSTVRIVQALLKLIYKANSK
jgi:hypothetical protein